MNLRHLIVAYCLTWLLQLGYLGMILTGWRRLRKPPGRDGISTR